ncbi:MAG: GAF domain-containing protein [Leptolyngbya sp. SIO1E4]|nr:GAF domain-containing protein [Leptolyngbya sp. SIO1E4]
MNESSAAPGDIATLPIDYHPPHFPDTIQPHGVLLVLDQADFSILQVSANTQEHLSIEPQQLLETPFETHFGTDQLEILQRCVSLAQTRVIPLNLSVETSDGLTHFNSFVHQVGTMAILEMEPATTAQPGTVLPIHALVRAALDRMQQATTRTALLQIVVDEIQHLTGYDRVLIYRFDEQAAGEVVAEATQADLTPYLGLHFPAYEIPALFRELYARGKQRMIPNMGAAPVALVPPSHEKTAQSPDLSLSTLRSPDPCCVEYYSNMGTSAALVASLLKDQKLWGLISCHHTRPKYLSYEVRAACEVISQMASSELANKVRQEDLNQRSQLNVVQSELIASIAQADNFIDALIKPEERLLTLVNAAGAAICLGKELTLTGTTPTEEQVRALIAWADDTLQEDLFQTPCLSQAYPEAESFKATASGLLLLRISQVQHYLILWFRPEVLQTINWGGKPDDGVQVNEDGQVQLCPRTSFELWQETVYATALPWQPFEINGALDLRNAIVGIVLKKADELARLNRELQHSNRELASFAYVAAHDLKEPLRGIYNYANILVEDYSAVLDAEGLDYLNEIQAFSQRMETLINALLRIAQLRQTELQLHTTDLNEVLARAADVVQASQPETAFDVRIPRSLPQIQCDPVLVSEVFRNLISNAIKYNNQPEKWIEVGYQDMATDTSAESSDAALGLARSPQVFYVRDNGIGISKKHQSMVFKLFKRLHPQEFYGGGVGVGLAIVSQIIERHGGRIWVESDAREGSTFFFTFAGG